MAFNNLKLKSTYSTYDDEISNDFYNPVLGESTDYDRVSAYFSCAALANYSKGLEIFAKKGNKYRLIISKDISEEDYKEILKGYELKKEIIGELILKINEPINIEQQKDISNLAYLISKDIVDIKIAFTKIGIFHDKFGIMKDEEGNIISFRGSNNETNAAYHANYESFEITCSWQCSEFDYEKIKNSREKFDELWNNKKDGIVVLDIPEIVKREILSFNKGKIIFNSIEIKENCLFLDLDESLKLYIKKDGIKWKPLTMFRSDLRRYIEGWENNNTIVIFKNELRYPDFEKIIDILERKLKDQGSDFFVSEKLKMHIKERKLYIKERSNIGIEIKLKSKAIEKKFFEYKKIVDMQMIRQLRDKQMWDSFFMCSLKKASNFSVPGSGKTASVFGVFAFLEYKKIIDKIIVIGPKNSFKSWKDEFYKCFPKEKPLKCYNIHNVKKASEREKSIRYETFDKNLLLFNYEIIDSVQVKKPLKEIINNRTLLVLDEVHRIKKIDGEYAKSVIDVSKNASFIIALTGTPIPNSYLDIKNILKILYRDEYENFFSFNDKSLFKPNEHEINIINKKLQPFFCRTNKQQLSVPSANNDILIESFSTKVENEVFEILRNTYKKNKLLLILRVLQLESFPKMLLESINIPEEFSEILDTEGLIEDIEYKDYSKKIKNAISNIKKTKKFEKTIEHSIKLFNGKKPFIIWCIFIKSIKEIKKELERQGLRVGAIFGETSDDEREILINQFKNMQIDVLITNPHTLGESVSLHENCHDAIYFEYSYNLVHLLQSKDRIHRLGLPENQYTQYYFMFNNFNLKNVNFSISKEIYKRLMEKEKLMLDAIENDVLEKVTTPKEDLDLIFNELKL